MKEGGRWTKRKKERGREGEKERQRGREGDHCDECEKERCDTIFCCFQGHQFHMYMYLPHHHQRPEEEEV